MLGLSGGDGVADESVLGAVEAGQGIEQGGVEGAGVEAGEVAFVGVVAGEGDADVVAVGAVASGGAGCRSGLCPRLRCLK